MRRYQYLPVIAFATLFVLTGCNAPMAGDMRPDPVIDKIGWENGYWYDDPVQVTTEDGLNESEREAVVARTMARVERIRDLEFKNDEAVTVEVLSRKEYREQRSGSGSSTSRFGADEAWNNQVWEALLLVGEDTNVSETFDSTLGASIQGYYSPRKGNIVLVSDTPTPTIDRGTLAHELLHALQDQHYNLGGNPTLQDTQLAHRAVVEGDANYVQQLYESRCAETWDCIEPPPRRSGGNTTAEPFNMGVFVTIFTPYATGPGFVANIHQQQGWRGVNRLYQNYPASTEQVIHGYGTDTNEPVNVTVTDRSNDRWNRFDLDRPAYDRVGEASLYAMLWANDQIDRDGQSIYEYNHPLSAGWGGDTIVPYRNGDQYGYVWVIAWDSRQDARDFVGAYRSILRDRASRRPDTNTFVLPDSDPFGDAFRVTQTGTRVRIVNAPTVTALDGID